MDDEKQKTNYIIADMTRQYKATQDELTSQTTILENQIATNKETIESLRQQKQAVIEEKNKILSSKNNEIDAMQKQIDELSSHFSKMLKDTLDKMTEKIKKANDQWIEENDNDNLRKFDNIVNDGTPGGTGTAA